MKNKDNITIFHLFRKNGSSLFLHPFHEEKRFFKILENKSVRGEYGHEPRVESITLFRNELYRMIEREVKAWITEVRFIPRFLLSAAAFIVTYLFLSFVIRDPIPMLDEVAISLGAGIVAYILLGKRDLKSDPALKKRISLRNNVDSIHFAESEFIKKIEEKLKEYESKKIEVLIDILLDTEQDMFTDLDMNKIPIILEYLENQFKTGDLKWFEKKLGSNGTKDDNPKLHEAIAGFAKAKKIDLPLFLLYWKLKESYRRAR